MTPFHTLGVGGVYVGEVVQGFLSEKLSEPWKKRIFHYNLQQVRAPPLFIHPEPLWQSVAVLPIPSQPKTNSVWSWLVLFLSAVSLYLIHCSYSQLPVTYLVCFWDHQHTY